jgi:hypothetical protein
LAPAPNNCLTRAFPFDIELTGYLPDGVLLREQLSGFAEYVYAGAPEHRTSVILRVCEDGDDAFPSSERVLALNYYGVARVDPGEWEVSRLAETDGGFVFAYTDQSNGTVVNCNDLPTGSVDVTESTFEAVSGTVNINARCVDEGLLERIPRDTTFTGTFRATNVGVQ